MSRPALVPLLALATLAAVLVGGPAGRSASADDAAPAFGSAFWGHWGDGRAELAGYDLVTSRYGDQRRGTAVAVFVTEPFSEAERVKANATGAGTFQVVKLNLVQDFPTGIYDYNLMTSVFVALEPVAGLPAGSPVKVSFSAQEWCGHVYQQALFGADGVRQTLHSYFQGEADRSEQREGRPGGIGEDALLLWARGLAYPEVAPGQSRAVPSFTSLERSRLAHVPAGWEEAELTRAAETREVAVPAGRFTVREATARVRGAAGERTWTFWVEESPPRRIVVWETSEGERAELLGADRLAYWKLHGPGGEEYLERLGLRPRGERMP